MRAPYDYGRIDGKCPVCQVPMPGQHDQAKHDRRTAEDYPAKGDAVEPPPEPPIPKYVQGLIDAHPDLPIREEYELGRSGLRVSVDPQPMLGPTLVRDELHPPRKIFGYE